MASLPMLSGGIALTHFIVAADVERAICFLEGSPAPGNHHTRTNVHRVSL
jgi:hypothetical protein